MRDFSLKRNIPNFITIIRIIGAIVVIFLQVFSIEFYIVYGLLGLTDCLDGFIARKYHLESKLGQILDSVADLIFLGVMGFKILPTMIELLAWWNWVIFLLPTFFHLLGYVICFLKFHRFSSLHSYANKIMSLAIFFYPFAFITFCRPAYEIYAIVFCSAAFYGSIEVCLVHLLSKEYDLSVNSLYKLIKKKKQNKNLPNKEEEDIIKEA